MTRLTTLTVHMLNATPQTIKRRRAGQLMLGIAIGWVSFLVVLYLLGRP